MSQYLTTIELSNCQQPMLDAPYATFNGVILNQYQVAGYNRYTIDINNEILLFSNRRYWVLVLLCYTLDYFRV